MGYIQRCIKYIDIFYTFIFFQSQRTAASPSLSTDSDSVPGSSLKPEHRAGREDLSVTAGSSRQSQGHTRTIAAHSDPGVRSPRGEKWKTIAGSRYCILLLIETFWFFYCMLREYLFCQISGVHPPKHAVPTGEENQDTNSQQPSRSGNIPALLPKPPLTPLVKLVGKVYSLKCRSVYKVQNIKNHIPFVFSD